MILTILHPTNFTKSTTYGIIKMEDVQETLKQYLTKHNLKTCNWNLIGEAELKTVVEPSMEKLGALFG